ncbi:MAG: TonB-dependent receptor plug domain-containing protein, partial [Minisyncoccales bacterium]
MHLNRAPLTIALVAAGLISATLAIAQTATLDPVIVTARPVVEDVNVDNFSTGSAVITQDQLRDQNAVDLASALRRTPGVQISRYNPVGAFGGDQGGAVFIRGMGVSRPGSEIKTYIDGVPFYMGLWSHPLLDLLPINSMQSITVYKSPQLHVNGNNFASVDLQTQRASQDGIHGDVRLSGGSFGTFTEQFNLLGRQGDLDWSLSQGHAQSNG